VAPAYDSQSAFSCAIYTKRKKNKMKLIERVKHAWWFGWISLLVYLIVATLIFLLVNSRYGQPSKSAFDVIKDWFAIVGGLAGLIAAAIGFMSTFKPLDIEIAHMDYVDLVINSDGTISKLHLPIVVTNLSKRPGAISSMKLSAKLPNGIWHRFMWEVFWREDAIQMRTIERSVVPIPLQPFSCAEKSIGFLSKEPMRLEPGLYEFELEVVLYRGGPLKKVGRFFAQPTQERCKIISQGHKNEINYVGRISISAYQSDLLNNKDL
jgi:hypothetical protein